MRAWMRSLTLITTMRTILKVKVEVDKMIAEEMRVSANKPADFLAELLAMPNINPQKTTLWDSRKRRLRVTA